MAKTNGAVASGVFHTVALLNAVTATTVSDAFNIGGAKRVSFVFTRAAHSSGSSAFKVEVSFDGTVWVEYNKLIKNVANTNAQQLTRQAAPTLSADGSEVYTMDTDDAFPLVRVTVTETTDGTHTAKLHVQY